MSLRFFARDLDCTNSKPCITKIEPDCVIDPDNVIPIREVPKGRYAYCWHSHKKHGGIVGEPFTCKNKLYSRTFNTFLDLPDFLDQSSYMNLD